MDKYKELFKALSEGSELSEDQMKQFAELRAGIESGSIDIEETPFTSAEEFKATADQFMLELAKSPEQQERWAKLAKQARAGEITGKVAQGLDLLLTGSDIMTSLGQISQSDRGLAALNKPSLPSSPRRNPLLAQQLSQAQRNIYDQSSSLAPAQAAIGDQYQQDLNVAKTASTGQASAFGSLAQVAANRRNRANMGLAQIAQQGANTARGRLDSLIGMQQDERQNDFRNRMYLGKLNLDQYNTEAQALGNLGAAGRQNLRSSFGKLAGGIAPMIGQVASNYNQPTSNGQVAGTGPIPYRATQPTGFGPDIDAYANDIEGGLFGRFQSPYVNRNYRNV